MYLEIVTPEATLYKWEVTSVAVPGVNGEFEMLKDHAPIVSLLKEGHIKLNGDIQLEEEVEDKFILHFNGQLAQENIEQVSAELTPIIQGLGTKKLVIDMMNCTYINSRTVAHFAMWNQTMTTSGGVMYLMAMQAQVADVIHVVGLDQIIKVINGIEEVI